jgi:hypothetical protein
VRERGAPVGGSGKAQAKLENTKNAPPLSWD